VSEFRALQRQKGKSLAWIVVAALVLSAALVLGLVPALNDALSGPPRYMEAFTTVMARETASAIANEYPVVVAKSENADCRSTGDKFDYSDSYFLLTFSEGGRSICFTVYGVTGQDSATDAVTLDPSVGRNYGRPLEKPAQGLPLHRSLMVLSPEYVALMDWRVEVDPSLSLEKAATRQAINSPSAQFNRTANMTVNFEEVRREVARRHDLVNRILTVLAVLSMAVLALFGLRLKRVYSESARLFRRHEFDLGVGTFLDCDLAVAGQEALGQYQQKREAALAAARLERSLEHKKNEASQRLVGRLESVQDEGQRQRMERALEGQELEEMQKVLEELAPQAAQPTPEERLHLLLETLKDYCSEEEHRAAETQVLAALRERGFRAARELAIGLHEEFRVRQREMEDKETEAPR
jgi:hypothetical protein